MSNGRKLQAFLVVDRDGRPGALFNDVAPLRWSRKAAVGLAAWLDGLNLGEWKRGPHKVVAVEIVMKEKT